MENFGNRAQIQKKAPSKCALKNHKFFTVFDTFFFYELSSSSALMPFVINLVINNYFSNKKL